MKYKYKILERVGRAGNIAGRSMSRALKADIF